MTTEITFGQWYAPPSRIPGRRTLVGISVLFVCTGNQCRSPMAAALFGALTAGRPGAPEVESAGFVSEGIAPPAEAVAAVAALGLDAEAGLAAHRSRRLTPALLEPAELIVTMTRAQLLDVVVMQPDVWVRTFTLHELRRRSGPTGSRLPGEPVAGWVARVNAGRTRAALVALPGYEDVADPIGGRRRDFDRTAAGLLVLTTDLADRLCPRV
jgi:protein-tyrosine phosphatase